jgi:hypothetical protein
LELWNYGPPFYICVGGGGVQAVSVVARCGLIPASRVRMSDVSERGVSLRALNNDKHGQSHLFPFLLSFVVC